MERFGYCLFEHPALSLACLFVLGAVDMVSVFIRQTLVRIETPCAGGFRRSTQCLSAHPTNWANLNRGCWRRRADGGRRLDRRGVVVALVSGVAGSAGGVSLCGQGLQDFMKRFFDNAVFTVRVLSGELS